MPRLSQVGSVAKWGGSRAGLGGSRHWGSKGHAACSPPCPARDFQLVLFPPLSSIPPASQGSGQTGGNGENGRGEGRRWPRWREVEEEEERSAEVVKPHFAHLSGDHVPLLLPPHKAPCSPSLVTTTT